MTRPRAPVAPSTTTELMTCHFHAPSVGSPHSGSDSVRNWAKGAPDQQFGLAEKMEAAAPVPEARS